MIDASRIVRIEGLLKEQTKINNELSKISGDDGINMPRIKEIYDEANDFGVKRGWSIMQTRQYFLFVVLYMYDPQALIKKMRRNGLREMVSTIMGITSNNVSQITKCLLFHFRLYSEFRESVNEFHDYIKEKYFNEDRS